MKSVSSTRNLSQRLKWLQDVFAGTDISKSSCYAKAISYYVKYGKPGQKFALLSYISSGYPTHMVVLDASGKRIVFDSDIEDRLSDSSLKTATYLLGNKPVKAKTVYVGSFEDLK